MWLQLSATVPQSKPICCVLGVTGCRWMKNLLLRVAPRSMAHLHPCINQRLELFLAEWMLTVRLPCWRGSASWNKMMMYKRGSAANLYSPSKAFIHYVTACICIQATDSGSRNIQRATHRKHQFILFPSPSPPPPLLGCLLLSAPAPI